MKHIAIITTGLVGITNASFKLASKLQSEGYKITYLCPYDIREKVERQNLNYIQLPEVKFGFSFLKTNTINSKSLSKFKTYLYHFTHLRKQYKEGLFMLNFNIYEDILDNLKPNLVLIDQELHEIIFSSIKLNIPVKLISQHLYNEMRIGLPPIRSNIIPGIGFKGSKLGILLAWSVVKLKIRGRMWINDITLKNSRKSILKRYAKNIGFSKKHLISSNFPSVYINNFIPTLSMNLLELEFPFSKPKNLTYIGAMILENRTESGKHQEVLNQINTIISLKKNANKKLIYCSLTTMNETGDIVFIEKVINALKVEPNWILIVSLGGKLSSTNFKKLPINVHIFKWVPQLKILKESDCSINHGGIHTINECILFKVPMLIYSGKKYDQNGCASRIAYHGLGLIGDKDLDDSEAIHSKINEILEVDRFQEKIKIFNTVYKIYEAKRISAYL